MLILPEVQILGARLATRSVSAGNHRLHDISPEEAATRFEAEGAEWLHVVDVDAARGAGSDNGEIVRRILEQAHIPVQVAGGIRTLAQITEWFEAGAARVVLGTVAITDQSLLAEASSRYPGGIVVNLATKDGWVMIDGWQTQTSFRPRDLVRDLQMSGIAGIVHTDIDRFEREASASLALTMELSREVAIPVFSSGTVHSLDDIARLRYLPNIHGAIVGHALIVGSFTLSEALRVAAQRQTGPETAPETATNGAVHRGMRAYLAAYSLSQGARWWNRALVEAITADNPYLEVLIPQDDLEIDPRNLGPREIQARYEREIDNADVVIVVLDGIENEAWTGFECGYGRARGKYLIGIRVREAGDDAASPPSRFAAMCDDVVDVEGSGDWHVTVATIAQEIGTRLLMQAPAQAASG